ncbi:unnamed protein product [Rotaria sp. Silwood2]|nr:unnamed protein product [Rotaria sp. Silwood2]
MLYLNACPCPMPRLLHSDNGREYVANVIIELKRLFLALCFVRGCPRHPQSQECIERANGVLCDALGKWMSTNNTSHWSEGLLSVVYRINTRVSDVTNTSPYQVMFRQPPRSDSEFWKLVQQYGIDDASNNIKDGSTEPVDGIDGEVINIVHKLSDDVVSNQSTHISSSQSRCNLIGKTATDNCLATANKNMNKYQENIKELTNRFNLNDCVGIPIHTVDRTNTDPKYLPCLIFEKIEKDNNVLYKLVCPYGKLENTFSAEDIIDLKSACPEELKQLVIDELKYIKIIEACKLFTRGSTSERTCDTEKENVPVNNVHVKKQGFFARLNVILH